MPPSPVASMTHNRVPEPVAHIGLDPFDSNYDEVQAGWARQRAIVSQDSVTGSWVG